MARNKRAATFTLTSDEIERLAELSKATGKGKSAVVGWLITVASNQRRSKAGKDIDTPQPDRSVPSANISKCPDSESKCANMSTTPNANISSANIFSKGHHPSVNTPEVHTPEVHTPEVHTSGNAPESEEPWCDGKVKPILSKTLETIVKRITSSNVVEADEGDFDSELDSINQLFN